MSQKQISSLENGKTPIKQDDLVRIAKALNILVDKIV
ncbi:MAG: helix-turn-helix domain-containing protein, partial [Flavobacteriales bacterium]